jgi:indole-3-glycerol phosphate synthase
LGDIQQIIAEAKEIAKKDVSGITLLAYRYPETQKLLENFINQINSNLIIAGNIDDTQKIKTMQQLPVQAFTIGTALINNEFPAKNNIRAQVEFVIKEMRKWGKR